MNDSYESTQDEAYLDRNLAVQVLAIMAQEQGYQMGIRNREDDWPILYIDLPTGQVSWHIPREGIVSRFPDYRGHWDGHNVMEKRDRLKKFLETQQ